MRVKRGALFGLALSLTVLLLGAYGLFLSASSNAITPRDVVEAVIVITIGAFGAGFFVNDLL